MRNEKLHQLLTRIRACRDCHEDALAQQAVAMSGLAGNQTLQMLQQSLIQLGAMPCAVCMSGMLTDAYALLLENPVPSREDMVAMMELHLCRRGAHDSIIRAIELAGQQMRDAQA